MSSELVRWSPDGQSVPPRRRRPPSTATGWEGSSLEPLAIDETIRLAHDRLEALSATHQADPDLAAFMDLMAGTMEAVIIQQERAARKHWLDEFGIW
jgi:hypothetical protein